MRLPRHLVPVLLLLWALASAAPASGRATPPGAHPSGDAPAAVPTFGEPTVSGVQGVGFEQGLRVSQDGTIYTTAPGSLSGGTSWIWRSIDHGRTFKWVPGSEHHDGKIITACVGGGDSELATDSANNLYFNDLTLANFSTSRSGDHGTTFAPSSCTGVTDSPVDRQWYAVDGDPTQGGNPTNGGGAIYLAYDLVGGGNPDCEGTLANNQLKMARSPLPGAGATAGVQFAPSQNITTLLTTCEEGIMGNNAVSPVDHRVFVVHDDAGFDGIRMGRCTPVSFTTDPTGLRCDEQRVTGFPGHVTGGSFPTMAIDSAGNLYAVWEEAPGAQGDITPGSDTALMFASSPDEGLTWRITRIPTPGLHNNVFAWPAAGDDGRVDVAWYGTDARNPDPATSANGCSGPDGVESDWGVYLAQTQNATAAAPTWTAPVLASGHFVHRGSIQTVMGGQCGDRTLGDFLQLRLLRNGAAIISYGDSNNRTEAFAPHPMVVAQNGGPGVFASKPTVSGPAAPRNSVSDPAGDATFDAEGASSSSEDNLDLLGSSISRPDPDHYRITMRVKDLTTLAQTTLANPDQTTVWMTQWGVPSSTDPNGGANFMVYMESVGGGAPQFWVGQNSAATCCQSPEGGGGGATLTYPGTTQLTTGVAYTPTAPGTITIDVPRSAVAEPDPIDGRLYQVLSSTLTYSATAEDPACAVTPTLCGHLFSLIDSTPTYDTGSASVGVAGHAR
jgi:hypothetical protein